VPELLSFALQEDMTVIGGHEMKKSWLLPLFLASASALADGLSVELNVRKSMATGKTFADVILVNSGTDDVTVFTRGLSQSLESMDNGKTHELVLTMNEVTWNGHKLVTSTCDYSPVRLKAGECAKYHFLPHPFTNPFKRIPAGASSLAVVYSINADQAKRHGIWSGKATSKTLKVQQGQIQQ